jgi:hypothetical protein
MALTEEGPGQILSPKIKPEPAFFEAESKGFLVHPAKPLQAPCGIAPEAAPTLFICVFASGRKRYAVSNTNERNFVSFAKQLYHASHRSR